MRERRHIFIAALLVLASSGFAESNENTITGCLTRGGVLTKLAVGDQPARPCRGEQTQISLALGSADGDVDSEADTIPFLVTLDGDGSEETIAVNGPLELFVRCELDTSLGQDQVSIRVFSEVAGSRIPAFPVRALLAGEDSLLMFTRTTTGPGQERFTRPANAAGSSTEGTSILAPDGSYIGVEASSVGLGLNVFGHDCVAVGTAFITKRQLE